MNDNEYVQIGGRLYPTKMLEKFNSNTKAMVKLPDGETVKMPEGTVKFDGNVFSVSKKGMKFLKENGIDPAGPEKPISLSTKGVIEKMKEIDKPLKEVFDGKELIFLAKLIDSLDPITKDANALRDDLFHLGNQLMSNGVDYGVRGKRKYD